MSKVIIYGLRLPDGQLFYIGQTLSPLKIRASRHRSEAKCPNKHSNSEKVNIIKGMGYQIDAVVLQTKKFLPTTRWIGYKSRGMEEMWIKRMRAAGHPLVNIGTGRVKSQPYYPAKYLIETTKVKPLLNPAIP